MPPIERFDIVWAPEHEHEKALVERLDRLITATGHYALQTYVWIDEALPGGPTPALEGSSGPPILEGSWEIESALKDGSLQTYLEKLLREPLTDKRS